MEVSRHTGSSAPEQTTDLTTDEKRRRRSLDYNYRGLGGEAKNGPAAPPKIAWFSRFPDVHHSRANSSTTWQGNCRPVFWGQVLQHASAIPFLQKPSFPFSNAFTFSVKCEGNARAPENGNCRTWNSKSQDSGICSSHFSEL